MLDNIENAAAQTSARRDHSALRRGPARTVYEAMGDGDFTTAQLAQAREFLETQLQAARLLDADLPEDMRDIPAWITDGAERTGQAYRLYLAERKAGAPRRLLSNKSHALHFLRGVAPTKLVDGAWLYGLLDHNEDARYAALINIYLEELGDGAPDKNHVVLYEKLLAVNDCDQWQELSDEHYVQGAIQLAMAYHARDFLPEIIGFNLGYEQLPLHLPITAYELNELGIDPYYFTLHITVDNADTGHAKKALQGLLAALPRTGDTQAFYRRVRNGYMLNELGASTRSVIGSFDLDQELVEVFERKAVVGKHMHSDYCRVGGRSVSEWLSTPGQIPAFLGALENSGWIKRHQDPQNSRFWKLLQGERAEMFGVFSTSELQLIHDWIVGDGAATFAQRNPSFRARQRLLGDSERMPHTSPTPGNGTVDNERASMLGMDRMDEFDADVRMLNEQISGMGGRDQLMRLLAEWMSPALHHTRPGLMATRLFTSRFRAAVR